MLEESNFIGWSLRLKKENTVKRTDHRVIETKFRSLVIIRIQGQAHSKFVTIGHISHIQDNSSEHYLTTQ